MIRKLPLFFAFAGMVACSTSAPETQPDTEPAPPPVADTVQTEPGDEVAEEASYIEYNFREGRTRAYLSFESPICQQDETAQPIYEMQALWRFDASTDRWVPMDVPADVPYRIACNAMLDLVNVLGFDLEPGTYAVAAEIGGTAERDIFVVGEMTCNDLAIGAPPEGQVVACVVSPSSAEARFVPDPADLESD